MVSASLSLAVLLLSDKPWGPGASFPRGPGQLRIPLPGTRAVTWPAPLPPRQHPCLLTLMSPLCVSNAFSDD